MSTVPLAHTLTGPADAPVLVLSGSLGSTRAMWDPQVAALDGGLQILTIDHRGHGDSPAPPGPYSVPELAEDVLALLDGLGIERAAFCGLSLGGMLGMQLAATAPQRVSALVLCCTTAHFPDPSTWVQRAAMVRENGTGSLAEAVVDRWFTPDWARANPERVDRYRQMVAHTTDEGYAGCCEAIRDWDGRALLDRIQAATLVLAGGQDAGTPPRPHAEQIASGIAGARLEVLEDAAHLATVQRADRVNELLAEHLDGAAG